MVGRAEEPVLLDNRAKTSVLLMSFNKKVSKTTNKTATNVGVNLQPKSKPEVPLSEPKPLCRDDS